MLQDLRLHREYERWYPLRDHIIQRQLVDDKVRFKIVPAGRRSGKTERAKRYMAKIAMATPNSMFFLAAPTVAQSIAIWWQDMKQLTLCSQHWRRPSESKFVIYLNNGTTIHIVGLDKPERIEGQPWDGGIVDEIANCKETAWSLNIKPSLNTVNPTKPNYRAWCWLIGVPEGTNFYHDLYENARIYGIHGDGSDQEWGAYTWFSSDILPPEDVEKEKRNMSAKQFRQEYEASFETASGRIYEDYGDYNLTNETIAPHEQLLWHHDFNFTPMSSGIAVRRRETTGLKRDCFLILDEIILTSAVARQSALEFVDRYQTHKNRHVIVYGDPAGRAGEKHGHQSDYTEIEGVLLSNGWTFERRVKSAAPAIKDRQNAVRAKIANAAGEVALYVNSAKAKYAHKGLKTVQYKEGSSFQEEMSEFQHITTGIGYMLDYECPINGKVIRTNVAGI